MYLLTKLVKYKIVMAIAAVFVMGMVLAPALPVKADPVEPVLNLGLAYGEQTGLGKQDVRETVSRIINVALGMLGIVAVVIVLWGGFRWMTAGGNEEKVGEAKKLLIAGLIGLVIILLAWGIATWVISTLQDDVLSVTS